MNEEAEKRKNLFEEIYTQRTDQIFFAVGYVQPCVRARARINHIGRQSITKFVCLHMRIVSICRLLTSTIQHHQQPEKSMWPNLSKQGKKPVQFSCLTFERGR